MNVLIPLAVVAVFGLAFGSFLNVCISRIPEGDSIVRPRSRCPRCGHAIRWYDNIPVLSFLRLRGRCRDCQQPISKIYPLVEILTSATLTLAFWRYRLSPEFIKAALVLMLLIILTITDLRTRRLPHKVTIFGIAAGLISSFFVPVDDRPLGWLLGRWGFAASGAWLSFLGSLGGALMGGGLFYAVGEVFYYASRGRKEYLGFGDVMLMLMMGSFFGIPLTLETILLGSLGGTLVALPLTVAGSRFKDYPWPYGTFLGAAGIFVSLGGDLLLDRYLQWAGLA
jgi:leader peptidase (prepilin peptidase) / N-methyltransferase